MNESLSWLAIDVATWYILVQWSYGVPLGVVYPDFFRVPAARERFWG